MRILVTGANGFVGSALSSRLDDTGHETIRAVRQASTLQEFAVGELDGDTDWSPILESGIDAVVHLAACVHQSSGALHDKTYTRVNTEATSHLARQCAAHGVKRFIFMSTAKVLGEGKETPYTAHDVPAPEDAYAISKWAAEKALLNITRDTGLPLVILRPPLVYGPHVKANFLRLMQKLDQNLPLPLGRINNRRSLIYLGNLIDAVSLCLTHPAAVGQTFMVSDGETVSTPMLIARIARALGRKARLLPIPPSILQWAGRLLGQQAAIGRLVGSFTIDTAPIQAALGWAPPYSMDDGLMHTAAWYQRVKANG